MGEREREEREREYQLVEAKFFASASVPHEVGGMPSLLKCVIDFSFSLPSFYLFVHLLLLLFFFFLIEHRDLLSETFQVAFVVHMLLLSFFLFSSHS